MSNASTDAGKYLTGVAATDADPSCRAFRLPMDCCPGNYGIKLAVPANLRQVYFRFGFREELADKFFQSSDLRNYRTHALQP